MSQKQRPWMFFILALFAIAGSYAGYAWGQAPICSSANYDGKIFGKFKNHHCITGICQQDQPTCSTAPVNCLVENCSQCKSNGQTYPAGTGFQCPTSDQACQKQTPAICLNIGGCS